MEWIDKDFFIDDYGRIVNINLMQGIYLKIDSKGYYRMTLMFTSKDWGISLKKYNSNDEYKSGMTDDWLSFFKKRPTSKPICKSLSKKNI